MIRRLAAALLAAALCTSPTPAAPEKPGGDQMTTYYVALLYKGPNWSPDETPEVLKLQEGHMENIRKMAASGKLVLAGPFTHGGLLRGMFVFRVDTLEEARALAENDPAVKAGRLSVEVYPWLSAKGIRAGAEAAK